MKKKTTEARLARVAERMQAAQADALELFLSGLEKAVDDLQVTEPEPEPDIIVARYADTCKECHSSITPGERIHYGRVGNVKHETCPAFIPCERKWSIINERDQAFEAGRQSVFADLKDEATSTPPELTAWVLNVQQRTRADQMKCDAATLEDRAKSIRRRIGELDQRRPGFNKVRSAQYEVEAEVLQSGANRLRMLARRYEEPAFGVGDRDFMFGRR